MKCWLVSDTHNRHSELHIPEGIDLVIHCGDESESRQEWRNEPEARAFFEWYSALEIATKIFVPGNHSTAIERGLIRPEEYPQVHFLIHQEMECNGLKIFGSPYTPQFFDWAYMRSREALGLIWQSLPAGVDILITHGPPKGALDVTLDRKSAKPIHVGSQSLMRHVVNRVQPKIHAFGHIHDEPGIVNFGVLERDGVTFVNCACCDNRNQLVNHGIVLHV